MIHVMSTSPQMIVFGPYVLNARTNISSYGHCGHAGNHCMINSYRPGFEKFDWLIVSLSIPFSPETLYKAWEIPHNARVVPRVSVLTLFTPNTVVKAKNKVETILFLKILWIM